MIISLCISIKNRLHHLKETLPRHLKEVSGFSVEIVVLDYGSSDGLGKWLKDNFSDEITRGIINYYRIEAGEYFLRSHARNLAFRLAKGEVICNLDADNYFEGNFTSYIREQFEQDKNCFLWACDKKYSKDLYGRLCFLKSDFTALSGFNEEMNAYGYEDLEFCERLKNLGRKAKLIEGEHFLKYLSHEEEDRLGQDHLFSEIEEIYLSYEGLDKTHVLLFLSDQKCYSGTLIKDSSVNEKKGILENTNWVKNTYVLNDQLDKIIISNLNQKEWMSLDKKKDHLINKNTGVNYQLITNPTLLEKIKNKIIMIENLSLMNASREHAAIKVNGDGFGLGRVTKNFNENDYIILDKYYE